MALLSGRELKARLRAGERFLSDGAVGTELMRRNVPMEAILQTNLTSPEIVLDVHRAYIAAGADIITSNTFGLREGTDWADCVRTGLGLALRAATEAERTVGVWFSLLPSAVPLEVGRLQALLHGSEQQPTALLIETCTTLRGAWEAARAAKQLSPDALAVTCYFGANGTMPDGTSVCDVLVSLSDVGVEIVGANCGDTLTSMLSVAEQMRSTTTLPVLIQPNAGLPQENGIEEGRYPVSPEAFAEAVGVLLESGVKLVGGCCGTGPAYIAAAKSVFSMR